ncbi:MAG: hypothetical protein COW84_09775 [Gammaproteobacteria bacterium CG22_combo_CG10-13_8_21_14_all_40_8]|nr:MAG: hypothetical protein COW84_09775 [Gammaproteobacteria bacterium CG22_combo_CG10-13_8_21_14_all_40_8]
MVKLNFNQKVWIGFAVIVILLSLSSVLSLVNLNTINDSTARVNESAVPVLKQSNSVQIALLKQAKLSSSGYNAISSEEIMDFSHQYDESGKIFREKFKNLEKLVENDKSMSSHTQLAKKNYQEYDEAVAVMFKAKLELLKQKQLAEDEAQGFMNDIDDAGATLLDISYFNSPEHKNTMDIIAGSASRIDGQLFTLINTIKEINTRTNLDELTNSKDDLESLFEDIQPRIDYLQPLVAEVGADDLWKTWVAQMDGLKSRASDEKHDLTQFKINQINQTMLAYQQLQVAEQAVKKSVEEFDQLLTIADTQFNEQQKEVVAAVGLGSKTALIGWVILLLLASQNFNSMRKSIKKKMADLAKLNHTGEILAATVDRTRALEEVLSAMHEQVGVAQGSVYLKNKEDRLVVKAFYPPKEIDVDNKPSTFALGEGVLGKSAQNQKIIYVPDTSKDPQFVNSEQPQAARALLCVPLIDKDILIGVMNFSGDVKTVQFEDSDYEFASAISGSLVTTIKNIHMREVIEEQNRTLEEKVRERTAELRQKNQDIATMMANMLQGLFTVVEGGIIHHEYSAHLEEILETENIANRNFMDLIFHHTNLGLDTLNQIQTAVDSLLGMDEMMFEFNSHLLVKEVVVTLDDGREKMLDLDWVPIIHNEEIEKIMVTVRDVTELRKLQKEAESQKQELQIIGQIIAVSRDKFVNFIKTSKEFIDKCRQLINTHSTKEIEVISELFRNIHTVKGNARTYGFVNLTDSVHRVEHTYDELRKQPEKQWNAVSLLEELESAENDVLRYEQIAQDKLGISEINDKNNTGFNQAQVISLLDKIEALDLQEATEDIRNCLDETYQTLVSVKAKPISVVIDDVVVSLASLASEIGKESPDVSIEDGNYLVIDKVHDMLNGIFMHIFRNSVDHGIENPQERLANGKNTKGKIELKTTEESDLVVFKVTDDGRGVAVNRIYQSAIEKGIYAASDPRPTAQEISNLIFSPGFSTAEKVTEISGRGVGMDAVKNFLEKQGGSIEVKLDAGDEMDDYRTFSTIIRLNKNLFIRNSLLNKSI